MDTFVKLENITKIYHMGRSRDPGSRFESISRYKKVNLW